MLSFLVYSQKLGRTEYKAWLHHGFANALYTPKVSIKKKKSHSVLQLSKATLNSTESNTLICWVACQQHWYDREGAPATNIHTSCLQPFSFWRRDHLEQAWGHLKHNTNCLHQPFLVLPQETIHSLLLGPPPFFFLVSFLCNTTQKVFLIWEHCTKTQLIDVA